MLMIKKTNIRLELVQASWMLILWRAELCEKEEQC